MVTRSHQCSVFKSFIPFFMWDLCDYGNIDVSVWYIFTSFFLFHHGANGECFIIVLINVAQLYRIQNFILSCCKVIIFVFLVNYVCVCIKLSIYSYFRINILNWFFFSSFIDLWFRGNYFAFILICICLSSSKLFAIPNERHSN